MSTTANFEKRPAEEVVDTDVENKKQRSTMPVKQQPRLPNDSRPVNVYMAGGTLHGNGDGHYFVPAIQGRKIKDICWMSSVEGDDLTGKAAYILHSNGKLFQWGGDQEFWYNVPHQERRISKSPFLTGVKQVACGYYHAAAVKTDGSVWTWGYENESGQLGRKPVAGNGQLFPPAKVAALETSIIQQVACSAGATFALDMEGKVFSWGSHRGGTTGQGKHDSFDPEPKVLQKLPPTKQISACLAHAGAVTTKGEVYLWGMRSKVEDEAGFRSVATPTLEAKKYASIVQLDCAEGYIGVVTSDGYFDLRGVNAGPKLNRAMFVSTYEALTKQQNNIVCKSISFGHCHFTALTTDGQLLIFGMNTNGQLGLGSKESWVDAVQKLPPVFSGEVYKCVAMGDFTAILTKDRGAELKTNASSFSLQSLFNNPSTFPDMEFLLDGEVICYAHKNILCKQSEYFRAMLQNDMKETNQKQFTVHNFPKDIFMKVMAFMYDIDIDEAEEMDPNTFPDLYDAAGFYQLDGLKVWCCEALEESLSLENVGPLLQGIHTRGDNFKPLECICLEFITENGQVWGEDAKNTDAVTDPKLWAKLYRAAFSMD